MNPNKQVSDLNSGGFQLASKFATDVNKKDVYTTSSD